MIAKPTRIDFKLLGAFAGLSLLATLCGVAAMAMSDISAMRWIPNVAAWTLGAMAALAMASTTPSPRLLSGIVLVALALVAATLAAPGQDGVHRWLAAGPLFVNIAALSLPAAIVAMARLGAEKRLVPIAATGIAAILAIQPDASQAMAFAFAALVVMLTDKRISALVSVLCIFALAALALLRPDPLQPVAEVEQIIGLAMATHPALGWAAMLSLAAIPLMLLAMRLRDTAARALALYIAAACVAPLFGWFPVPLVGAGMSFPLGLWLGIGLLAARRANA